MLSLSAFVSVALALSQFASATIKANDPIQLRINAADGNKACLTASGNKAGATVVVGECKDSDAQYWKFPSGAPATGASAAQPIKIYDNLCLDVKDGKDASGTKLQLWTCVNGSKNQQWVVNSGAETSTLQWAGHTRCVDNTGGYRNGTTTQVWTCSASNANQKFNPVDASTTSPTGTPLVFAHDVSRKTCFGVEAAHNGAPVITTACEPRNDKNTWIQSSANGPITISGDFCLDITDGKNLNGNPLQIWTCAKNSGNQKFNLASDLTIQWLGKGKCVDLTNGNVALGNKLQIWTCDPKNPNQIWHQLPPL